MTGVIAPARWIIEDQTAARMRATSLLQHIAVVELSELSNEVLQDQHVRGTGRIPAVYAKTPRRRSCSK
jgi:hypothetical protein